MKKILIALLLVCSAAFAKGPDVGYPSAEDINASVSSITTALAGKEAVGYLAVASGATTLRVRCKVLSGLTAAAEGDSTSVAHGLTAEKIISYHAKVEIAANTFLEPEYSRAAEYKFSVQHDATDFNIQLAATDSGNILSKRVIITVFYAE